MPRQAGRPRRRRPATPARCVLSGELDLSSVEDIRRAGWAALKVGGPDMVVDMSGVTFLDCNGLDPLLELRGHVRAGGGRLTLTGSTRPVQRLLDVTGLAAGFGCASPGTRPPPRWSQLLGPFVVRC